MDLDRNKIAFISCVNDEDMYKECLLYLKSLRVPHGMSIEYIPVRNAVSMCAGYNEGAHMSDAKYKIYLHQDVLVVNKDIISDLLSIFEDTLTRRRWMAFFSRHSTVFAGVKICSRGGISMTHRCAWR